MTPFMTSTCRAAAGPADSRSPSFAASAAYPLRRDPAEHARLEQQARFWAADTAALFDSAALAPGSRVADLGCGTLHVATAMAERVGADGTVLALDNDAALLDRLAGSACANIVVECGDAYAAPWPDASLDAAHARFLAAPAGRLGALVAEMRRLVRPGGLLLLQEPLADSWSVPAEGAAWPRLLDLIRAGFRLRGGDFDSGGQLADALRSAGVRDVRTRAVAHTIGAGHSYARLPLAFAASLEPLWRQSGLVGESELAALRAAIEAGLDGNASVTTTFTLVQAWGRR